MIQVSKLIPHGQGLAPVLLKRATTVELDWDVRQKSRFAATDSAGRELGIFLPRGTLVRGGDVLGRWSRPLAGGELQVQAYFDRFEREEPDTIGPHSGVQSIFSSLG